MHKEQIIFSKFRLYTNSKFLKMCETLTREQRQCPDLVHEYIDEFVLDEYNYGVETRFNEHFSNYNIITSTFNNDGNHTLYEHVLVYPKDKFIEFDCYGHEDGVTLSDGMFDKICELMEWTDESITHLDEFFATEGMPFDGTSSTYVTTSC